MADGNRTYPVKELIMHHSVGPEFKNSTDLAVQDWFDEVGRTRGYAGQSRSYHDHPQRDKETFAQAHLALREYTTDGNKYGWRLTPLLKDIWNNVAWHAGTWSVNQRSIGIETCGNFVSKKLPNKALMLVADFWREQDIELNGATNINGHREYSATACPGQIYDQLDTLIDMVNSPDKWNAQLFGSTNTTTTTNNPTNEDCPIDQEGLDELNAKLKWRGKVINQYRDEEEAWQTEATQLRQTNDSLTAQLERAKSLATQIRNL